MLQCTDFVPLLLDFALCASLYFDVMTNLSLLIHFKCLCFALFVFVVRLAKIIHLF